MILLYTAVIDDAVECIEVTKKFRDFVIMRLREKYSKVIMRLIHIFKEKQIDIE